MYFVYFQACERFNYPDSRNSASRSNLQLFLVLVAAGTDPGGLAALGIGPQTVDGPKGRKTARSGRQKTEENG